MFWNCFFNPHHLPSHPLVPSSTSLFCRLLNTADVKILSHFKYSEFGRYNKNASIPWLLPLEMDYLWNNNFYSVLTFPFSKPGVISLLPGVISLLSPSSQNRDDSANAVLAGMPSFCPTHNPGQRREIITVCCLVFSLYYQQNHSSFAIIEMLSQIRKQFSRNQICKKKGPAVPQSVCNLPGMP